MTQPDRQPPHDHQAEQIVLGAMMLAESAILDVTSRLVGPGDFYRPHHAEVYRAILAQWQESLPVDPVAILDRLGGAWAQRHGASALHVMVEGVPLAASAGYHAGIVAEKAKLRRIGEVASRVARAAFDSDSGLSADELAGQVGEALDALNGPQDGGDGRTDLASIIDDALGQIEAAAAAPDVMPGVPTGFADLDRLTGGLRPGQLVVIGARPGIGKSTLGADFCRAAAIRHNLPTIFFTLEMSKAEMGLRILSAESRVPLHVLRTGRLTADDQGKLAKRVEAIAAAPLHIVDDPAANLAKIKATARRIKAATGRLGLVVVDYLQLMPSATGRRDANREQEVSALSRGLKLLAKDLDVPIVAMSQLNRGSEHRVDKRPQLSDLRESGAVEQDADIVILIDREDARDKESPRAGEADLIVAKHRNGPTDTITVFNQLHLCRFVDWGSEG